tara:strand:- start:548 stop:796 length:249 start_codon:yes stop_codon:yes gene_type:complete
MKLYRLPALFLLLSFLVTSACLTTGNTYGNVKKQSRIIVTNDISKIENQDRVYTVDLVLYENEGKGKEIITLSPPEPDIVSP